jgi:hypothetical protein
MLVRNICFLLVVSMLPAACGGGGPVTGGAGEAPPPTRTPLPDMPFTVAAGGAVRLDFDVAEPGSIFASIDWQDPARNLVAVVTGRGCHSVNDALAGRCSEPGVVAVASTCHVKPRRLHVGVYTPAALRLWIANTGADTESGGVALVHCKEAPDCGATGSCTQCLVEGLTLRSCAPW